MFRQCLGVMDDSLENPTVALPKDPVEDGIDDDDLDGDAALDWANLPKGKVDITRPIIPKRGEKYFEPVGGPSALPNSGSGLQQHMLDKARSAMYSALKAERGISSKTVSYALWFPETGYAQVILARGAAFGSLGYSNVRESIDGSSAAKEKGKGKSLELLPEEALYMVERGSMYCWRVTRKGAKTADDVVSMPLPSGGDVPLEEIPGTPMSVQEAFAEMIGGASGLTTEQYQVYAYLKRLGYTVTRTRKPSGVELYPLPGENAETLTQVSTTTRAPARGLGDLVASFFQWIKSLFLRIPFVSIGRRKLGTSGFGPWSQPLVYSDLFRGWTRISMGNIFEALRIIPSGHRTPLHIHRPTTPTIYTPFYNVYKPSTPFKKTAPPKPDYNITVVNARASCLPTLLEMSDMFNVVDDWAPPLSKKAKAAAAAAARQAKRDARQPSKPIEASLMPAGALDEGVPTSEPIATDSGAGTGILAYFASFFSSRPPPPPRSASITEPSPQITRNPPTTNPFAALKNGKKNFVVAVVDNGSTSFIRFTQGTFEDWPMYTPSERDL
ncbi:tRNA-splicing endonuclease subunit sen54 [Tulasnella sp. 425]|nr:tRNA-splicing endonuclease subunit sen54 [Tulasnella sp. 425]